MTPHRLTEPPRVMNDDYTDLEARLRTPSTAPYRIEAADAIAALRKERDSWRKSSDGLARTAAELRIAYTDALVRAEAAEAALAARDSRIAELEGALREGREALLLANETLAAQPTRTDPRVLEARTEIADALYAAEDALARTAPKGGSDE